MDVLESGSSKLINWGSRVARRGLWWQADAIRHYTLTCNNAALCMHTTLVKPDNLLKQQRTTRASPKQIIVGAGQLPRFYT